MAPIELTELEQAAFELIQNTYPPGRNCARNAYLHIQKAWVLEGVDNEMAAFRAITAEEEAASALFHSLKRLGYKGSDKLKVRNHIHKNAVIPFCRAVSGGLAHTEKSGIKTALYLDKSEKPWRFRIQIDFEPFFRPTIYGYPEPPLNFTTTINGKP